MAMDELDALMAWDDHLLSKNPYNFNLHLEQWNPTKYIMLCYI